MTLILDPGHFPRDRATWVKLGVVCGLLMGQTLPSSLLSIAVPAILRKEGMALDMMWLLQVAALPWTLKWLWAPIVDRYGSSRIGRRKSWIIPLVLLAVLVYAMISQVTPKLDQLYLLVSLLFVRGIIVATLDIATDGFTVENLDDKERVYGAAIFDIANTLVSVVAIAGLMAFYDRNGWTSTILLAGTLFALLHVPVLVYRERAAPAASIALRTQGQQPSLLRFLRRRDGQVLGLISFGAGFGTNFTLGLLSPYFVDVGFSTTQIGIVMGVAGLIGFPAGSLTGAAVASRLGFPATLKLGLACMPLLAIPCYLLATLDGPNVPLALGSFAAIIFLFAIPTIVFTSARFAWTSQAQAGTDFTIQSSIYGVGRYGAVALAGVIAEHLGWPAFLTIGAVLFATITFLYAHYFERIARMMSARAAEEAEGRFA